jgi:hypothetical protein
MTEHNSSARSSFGAGYFFLGLVGVYLLVLGLLKQDNLLRIAVFGPLLTGASGLFLLMLTVDWRHGLSSSLQSATSSLFHRLSLKESSRLLSVSIIFLSLNLMWLSAFFLPRNTPSMFGFALLSAAGLAPLLLGQLVASSTKLVPSALGNDERSDEFDRITNALRNNARHRLNARQNLLILKQENQFRGHVRYASADIASWSKLLDRFESASKQNQDALKSRVLDFFTSEAMPYFSHFLRTSAEHDEVDRQLVEATFIADPLSELLLKIAREDGRDPRLHWSIGWVLSGYLFPDIALSTVRRGTNASHKVWDQEPHLFAQVLTFMADSEKSTWDPWFLCTFQLRLRNFISHLSKEDATKIVKAGRALKADPILPVWQSSVFDVLLGAPEPTFVQRTSMLSSGAYTSIRDWPGLEGADVNEASFRTTAEQVLSSLPLKRSTWIDEMLTLMLVLSFQREGVDA